MLSRILSWARGNDSGQAIIVVAILGAGIMMTCGLAVEGGRILVEYRHLQNAADMAAIVGAQNADCSSTDTTCINTVLQDACNWAQNNGYGGGWSGSSCLSSNGATVTPSIAPNTCSPYNMNYGNGRRAANSCVYSLSGRLNYVEVQITQNLGIVPFFNVSVSPSAHAVARKGATSPRDYAIVVLDKTLSDALDLGGTGSNPLYVIGSIMSDSTASNSINTHGSASFYACGGDWNTASPSESTAPSGLQSYVAGSAFFSPAGCTGTQDSSVNWNYGQFPVTDPYLKSVAPPSSWTSCSECSQLGHYYHWTAKVTGGVLVSTISAGTWDAKGQGTPGTISGSSSDYYEFFPGSYPAGIKISGGNVFFNPGVYKIGGGGTALQISGSNACIFGAPICDEFPNSVNNCTAINNSCVLPITGNTTITCGNASVHSGDATYVAPATWYYYCSPWGTWDTWRVSALTTPASIASDLATAPTYTDGTTAVTSGPMQQLNGITFYTSGSSSVKISGNAGMSLAFPDPCPGTQTTTPVANSVPFQSTVGQGDSGNTQAQYSYNSTMESVPYQEAGSTQTSPAGRVYPSADLTVNGEQTCRSAWSGTIPEVWPSETLTVQPGGQLQHFLVWMRDATASISLAGGGTQIWWGILYNPGDYSTVCGGSTSGCQISLTGGSGGTGGPPFLLGQIVGDGVSLGGSATLEVFYRPCDPSSNNCQAGPGTSLVQ